MTRERISLREPPTDPAVLRGGPETVTYSKFARCARSMFSSPWFFSADGQGRFDLVDRPGKGTCYIASDEIGAMREVLGPDYVPGVPVSRALFDDRTVWALDPTGGDWSAPTANLRHDHWDANGLTQEVFSIPDYSIPQRWASALFDAGYAALTVALRHVLDPFRFGLALFGPEGAQTADERFPSVTPRPIDDSTLARFTAETNITIGPSASPVAALIVVA